MDPWRMIENLVRPKFLFGEERSERAPQNDDAGDLSGGENGGRALGVTRRDVTASLKGPALAQIGAAVPTVIFGVAAVSVPLATAQAYALTDGQTASMIFGLYGIPGVLCLLVARIYRQPLLIAWHIHGLVFITALSVQYTYAQVLGGLVVAGALVFLLGALRLSARIASLIPTPIVFGIVAGTAMPFVVRVFDEMSLYPLLIGATVGAYVASQRLLSAQIPPILPALIVGGAMAALLGDIGGFPRAWSPPVPELILPAFSWQAILSIAPVMAVFIGLQSNLTTSIYLRSQGYDPPDRLTNVLTGAGTSLGAILGATPISSGSAVIALVAGPDAGEHRSRFWTIYLVGAGWLIVAFGATIVATLPSLVPLSLLFALAGIVLLGVLRQALQEVTRGPLRFGPVFAFVIASSELSLFGLGALFWALVIGMAATLILEPESYSATRSE